MRISAKVSLVPLLALALAGCSTSTAANATGPNNQSPSAPLATIGTRATTDGASGGDPCRYPSVDEVRQALDFQDQMTTSQDSLRSDPICTYSAPNAGFVNVTLVVASGRKYYDDEKSLTTEPDCTSANVGTDSLYCPKSNQGWVVFVANGSSVSLKVMNIQSIAGPKGTDSTQASLALAKLVAGRV